MNVDRFIAEPGEVTGQKSGPILSARELLIVLGRPPQRTGGEAGGCRGLAA
jgi:hypothetical protein